RPAKFLWHSTRIFPDPRMPRWRPNYDGSRRRRTCATRPMRSCYRPSWRRCATVLPLGARLDPPVLPPPRAHSSHPLLLFNGEGDCLGAKLRPGNVHSAEDWAELLLPEIEHQKELGKEVVFRADAAFAKPEIYEALEERGVKYAVRTPANDSLERDIAELLTRPVGRPSHKPVMWYKGFLYQAASWKTGRRVVAKVEFHTGELFPRVGFIVTNLETPSRTVVRFYNKRGTAEQWIKEGKHAVKMTRLSCHRFRSNQVRLALSLLAYNLGNLWRRL